MLIRSLIVVLITVFCCGCSFFIHSNSSTVSLAKDVNFKLLGLWKIDEEMTLNQHFKGQYKDNEFNLNLVTQISKNKISIIGLTPFGTRAFTLEYDGKNIDFELPEFIQNSKKIKPEYILADIQLIYYPVVEIRKNLDGNVKITEIRKNGIKRIFYKNNIPFIEINYSSDELLKSKIHYKNLLRQYHYTIYNL